MKLDEDSQKGYGGVVLAEELQKTIKVLYVGNCNFSETSLLAIGDALRNSTIEVLDLSANPNLSDAETFNYFVNSIREMPKLIWLKLEENSLNEHQRNTLNDIKQQRPKLQILF